MQETQEVKGCHFCKEPGLVNFVKMNYAKTNENVFHTHTIICPNECHVVTGMTKEEAIKKWNRSD